MEVVSVLAGEPWCDPPRTSDPTLAVIARLINDEVSDAARTRLRPLIPGMLDTDSDDERVPLALARVAADVAAAYGAMTPGLVAPPPPAVPRPGFGEGSWLARVRRAHRVCRGRRQAEMVVAATAAELAQLPAAEADAALIELLTAAITVTREYTHPQPDPGPGRREPRAA